MAVPDFFFFLSFFAVHLAYCCVNNVKCPRIKLKTVFWFNTAELRMNYYTKVYWKFKINLIVLLMFKSCYFLVISHYFLHYGKVLIYLHSAKRVIFRLCFWTGLKFVWFQEKQYLSKTKILEFNGNCKRWHKYRC